MGDERTGDWKIVDDESQSSELGDVRRLETGQGQGEEEVGLAMWKMGRGIWKMVDG